MKKITTYMLLLLWIAAPSCQDKWLAEKSDKSLVVPSTIEDFQALLDNANRNMNLSPGLGEIATDDYYVKGDVWQSLFSVLEKNAYIWKEEDLYGGEYVADWALQYRKVFYTNVALEGIADIVPDAANQTQWDNVKGSALFFRAYTFYCLAQLFAPVYNSGSAGTDLGIPLRLNADVEEPSARATLQQTYDQIIQDLEEAVPLLPVTPQVKTRPSRPAAFALLAKTYLVMEDYEKASAYASQCLELYDSLMDFNSLAFVGPYSFSRFNEEVLFDSYMTTYSILFPPTHLVSPDFLKSYASNDLRKTAFFQANVNGDYTFKGSYGGAPSLAGILWGGIATDEIHLILAECQARTGNVPEALQSLNYLARHRYDTATFIPFTAASQEQALGLILSERRKELPYRGIRFEDLRRLNKDTRFAITLSRELNGQEYELPPNDPRYTYPIPDKVIQLSGLEQNPR